MVEITDILENMKQLLGMAQSDDFENESQANIAAELALSTSQIDDAKIIAILACYYYTRPRETDEENDTNIYWEMYQNAVSELTKEKITPNDDDGLSELDGAVFNDDIYDY